MGAGHAVFGVARIVHHLEAFPGLTQGEDAAGIVAAADLLRNMADGFLQKAHQRQIIQVDDGAQPVCQLELLCGRIIGGEHDPFAGDAAFLRHHQLRQRGAVAPAAFLFEDLQNSGGGGGLYGEILPVTGIPRKGGFQAAGILPDPFFVVNMKGGRVLGSDFFQLLLGDKGRFHDVTSNPSVWV